MKAPLVSILIPAYNAEASIAETIKSALAQTWSKKEIIVVDDGSKDLTLTIARQFVSSNVLVTSQRNEGAAAARNRAYSLSQGDFIQWLDADDLLASDKIERQAEIVQEGGVDSLTLISGAFGSFFHRIHKAQFIRTSLWSDMSPVDWMIRKLEDGSYMQTGVWLVSRELCDAAGQWDTRLLGDDDGEYFCRVLLKSKSVKFVESARVYYRRPGPAALSYIGQSRSKIDAQFLSMKLHIERLRAVEDSPRVRTACVKYLQAWLYIFFPERLDIVKELEKLASELGGSLKEPELSRRYFFLKRLFGWQATKRFQFQYNNLKTAAIRRWDKCASAIEKSH